MVPTPDPMTEYNFGAVSLEQPVQAGELVPMHALDDLDLPACHFLKVDVEGMEAGVLRGALRTIESYRPLMYLENDRDDHSEELLRLVLDLEYAAYWHLAPLYNPDNFAGEAEDVFPGIVSANIACVPAERGAEIPGLRRVHSPRETWRG
jgi:Methyltransferase FkbM domain